MRVNDKEEKVKEDMDEIETINIELEHSVAKLLSENKLLHNKIEHLKKIYKDQFDLIKKTCVLSKEHYDFLIAQWNSKFMENADLKGKEIVENAAQIPNATTISPGMFKLDLVPLAPRITNNSEPNHSWGSNATDFPSSSSLVNDRNRLGHNLFSVRKFYDSDLEVAFQKNTCFIRNLDGVDLLSGSRDTNLYTISLDDMLKTSLICLVSKASKTKSCMCISKSKKSSHQLKAEDTNQEKLYLLHMDLCSPMRVESINGKNEDLGKLNTKADIGIFVGYALAKKAFKIYNRRTRKIMETIHVTFNELTAMASEQFSSGPGLQFMTPATSSS
ncbi:hypothetical protein Tco_0877078 [Tanacetum coccineum]|uniref:Retroviral polymerase SH3-like domain-containing protein n=1 Tax=Tanacetum coccineum TaxID=301880 RepID=A0ABQ5BX43_9ASTR